MLNSVCAFNHPKREFFGTVSCGFWLKYGCYRRPAVGEQDLALNRFLIDADPAMKARTPAPDWLERVIGSMKDEPAFDEVLAYGRAIREADRPTEEQGRSCISRWLLLLICVADASILVPDRCLFAPP